MINRLKEIKKLRKTRKLIAEEKLKKLGEIDHEYENTILKIKKIESEINQLEKDLKNLTDLELKFKQNL